MKMRKRFNVGTILREVLVIFLSGVAALIMPFSLVTYGAIRSPRLAYALMFWLYAQCYLLLKRYFLKSAMAVRPFEFELVSLALTAYMVGMLPLMRDQPDIVQLPACYWTFIFISFYVSVRGRRHNKCAPPNGGPATQVDNSRVAEGPPSVS